MGNINDVHRLDEIDYPVQGRIDKPPIVPYQADPQLAPLPQFVVADLCDGDIEPRPHPIDDPPDHLALSLKGAILRDNQIKMANTDDHLLSPGGLDES
jgi:hypothetical protein